MRILSSIIALLALVFGAFCLMVASKMRAIHEASDMELPVVTQFVTETSGWFPAAIYLPLAFLLIFFAIVNQPKSALITSIITMASMLAGAALISIAVVAPLNDTPSDMESEPKDRSSDTSGTPLHPSMIAVNKITGMSFTVDDPDLQALHDLGMKQLQHNLSEFAPGMTILVEGGGYDNAWLETQPMGGEAYAKHDLQVALNNQVIFMRGQREDGRLPGMVITGSKVAEMKWDTTGFPAGYVWKPEHDIIADYEMFQGYCFPEPAWRMYFWIGENQDYLRQLAEALKAHDAYLWRTRDSNGDGLLETWCVWDTGEDGSTRLHQRGAKENWPFELPPGSNAPGIPAVPEDSRMPFQSMDIMAYSYSGRAVLAKIAAELNTGDEEKWRNAAEDVRNKVIEKLWDPQRHACFDRDRDGRVLPELIHNNLRCMWYGMFTQEMADAFIKHHLLNPDEFWTPVPLVSIARNEALYLSKPRNNWSGQPQGLTYQRAIHALERYGHYAEVTLLGKKLIPVLIRNGQFSQQLHPDTGIPSLSNADGYGPMILAMQEYVARMHGIHIDVEQKQIWWSGVTPDSWSSARDQTETPEKQLKYTQNWGDYELQMTLESEGNLTGKINGAPAFTASPNVRVVTNMEGTLISVVGINTVEEPFHIDQNGQGWSGKIAPNEVLKILPDGGLEQARLIPFDYPYQASSQGD